MNPVGSSGVAHYLEHLLFKATDTVSGEFQRIIGGERRVGQRVHQL
jgi:predicted Zn-dependent peptidase